MDGVLGIDFEIREEHIDKERVLVIPGDGVIMPIAIDKVTSLLDHLIKYNKVFIGKSVKIFYIFLMAETREGILCVRYIDGEVSVIQHLGKIDLGSRYIT